MKSKTEILSLRLSNNEISISKFEKELYGIDEPSQLFQDLLELNFKSKNISGETTKVITTYIRPSEIATYKLNQLLNNIISNSQRSFQSLLKTYDLRCKGYWFLEELGMNLALTIISSVDETIFDINRLPQSVKEEYHKIILPKAISEAARIQNLLETREIIVTGDTIGMSDRLCWIDNRIPSEIDMKELDTIQFHSKSNFKIRETKDEWLQGGPLFEMSALKTNQLDKKGIVEQEINHLRKWNAEFQITTDTRTFNNCLNKFICGHKSEGNLNRSFKINCQIDLQGKRKAVFLITELSDEIYSTNLYMFGSRLPANEWNEIGITEFQEKQIISLAKKYIGISIPIVFTIGYEDDCISLFRTKNAFPSKEYSVSNLNHNLITEQVRNRENGFEYCYIHGCELGLEDDVEIKKTT